VGRAAADSPSGLRRPLWPKVYRGPSRNRECRSQHSERSSGRWDERVRWELAHRRATKVPLPSGLFGQVVARSLRCIMVSAREAGSTGLGKGNDRCRSWLYSDQSFTAPVVPPVGDGLLPAPPLPPRHQVGCSRLDRQDPASQHAAHFRRAQPCIAGLHRLYLRASAVGCRRPRQHLHAGGECLAEG
jgi:hypothetical protein